MSDDLTLVERWLKRLNNNPLIAAVVVVGVIITEITTFFKSLPDGVQATLEGIDPFIDSRPKNGWAWAGYLDKSNQQVWAQGPFVTVIKKSEAVDRPYPIRVGDTVTPTRSIDQVIVDYRDKRDDNVLVPPSKLKAVISPIADYTGLKFKPGEHYIVSDVSTAAFPNADRVVWLRLTTAD